MQTTEQQRAWLERVESLFMRYGIKSQTMDDISTELGISKKTLYQMVSNKDELVKKVLQFNIEREAASCLEMASRAENAIAEILAVVESNAQQLVNMKANVLYDLQKYHREAWLLFRNFHFEFVLRLVMENIRRGRAEGLYRRDFDIDIIARIHLATVFNLFDEELFPSTSIPRDVLFREYMMHYLHGIISENGLSILRSKLNPAS